MSQSTIREQFRRFIEDCMYDETEAMNRLQDHGMIADECVTIDDVPEADLEAAMQNHAWIG